MMMPGIHPITLEGKPPVEAVTFVFHCNAIEHLPPLLQYGKGLANQTAPSFHIAFPLDRQRDPMRTDRQILDELTTVFQNVFDDDDLKISARTVASDIPEWDSLMHVRLMLSTQTAFKIKFSAADVTKLKSVGDLVALIQRKTS